jgi:hypothetical protein
MLPTSEKADRRLPVRQQVEVCLAALKSVFGMDRTLAKTLTGLATTRIAAKVAAYKPPTAATSTGCSVVLKGASGTCGHKNLATLI